MHHSLDFTKLPSRDIYRWMIHAIVPRPIAFVSTVDENGVVNLAPFSFFNGVSSSPPCLAFSITKKGDGSKKDTLRNLEKSGEFVVNASQEGIVEQVNAASEEFPYGVSEVEKIGLSTTPSLFVRPPRIAECDFQMECRLEKQVEIGEGPGSATLVIGRILGLHVAERILTDGKIDYTKLKPLARLGGKQWLKGGEVFELTRPVSVGARSKAQADGA